MPTYDTAARPIIQIGDWYFRGLLYTLMGYATIGKGFAYLGYPPLFIGEIALLLGILVLIQSGYLVASLATLPSFLLAILMAWVLARTLPYLSVYGFDAPRDSVVVMYGVFAFIVAALLLQDRHRLAVIVEYYRRFLGIFVPLAPFVLALDRYAADYVPHLLGSNVPVIQVRTSEAAVHVAGAAVFALVGFRKAPPLWIVLVLITGIVASVSSRGAMLAIVVPIVIATVVIGKVRQLAIAVAGGLMIFALAYAIETTVTDYHDPGSTSERPISTRQIGENIASIFGRSGVQSEGTKTWRIDWWNIIISNTVRGPYFWTGRGFGLNLAMADGFGAPYTPDRPVLRSPHNVHMTLLARAGIPGVVLWWLFLTSWFGMLGSALLTAIRRRQTERRGFLLFIGCYVIASIINATFDVALEGPMLGIWFWCLIGLGIGTVMIYRYQPDAAFRP